MTANPFSFLLILGLVITLCLPSASAQGPTTGRIVGTVVDQNGARIVWADITIKSDTTADERKTQTDKEGNYAASLLSPGTYSVTISAQGFSTTVMTGEHILISRARSYFIVTSWPMKTAA